MAHRSGVKIFLLAFALIVQVVGVVRADDTSLEGMLSRAKGMYLKGRYSDARDAARSIISMKPQPSVLARATLLLARSCYMLGDYGCSVDAYSRFFSFKVFRASLQDYLFFGISLEKEGSFVEAVKVYSKAGSTFRSGKELAEILYRKGLLEHRLGRLDEAVKSLLKALEMVGKNKEMHMMVCFALGDCYMERGNTLAARSFYWEALSLGVDCKPFLRRHIKTYQNLSDIRFMFGFYEEAASGYLEIARLYGKGSYARKNILKAGDCYLALGRPRVALELYARVIRDYPDSDESYIAMLKMADMSVKFPGIQVPPKSEYGPYRRPLDTYVMLTKVRIPELAQLAYIRASEFLSGEGNYKGAMDMILKGMEAFPWGKLRREFESVAGDIVSRWIEFLFGKGDRAGILRVYADYGEWLKGDRAASALKDVARSLLDEGLPGKAVSILLGLRLKGKDNLLLARGFVSLGKYPEAISVLRRYLKKYPKDCEAHKLMGDALFGLGSKNAARHYSYVVKNCGLRDRSTILRLAETYNRSSRFKMAVSLFRKYFKGNDISGFSAMIFADSYYGLGRFSQALKLYRLALKGVPEEDVGYVYYMMELCKESVGGEYSPVPLPKDVFWRKLCSSREELFSWSLKNRKLVQRFSGKGGVQAW